MLEKESPTPEKVNQPTPGARLRQAREQAGISLQSISQRTLISVNKLQALERDDYSAVGGTAHVTGYGKAYAKVLGLDEKKLVRDIESALGAEQSRVDTAGALAASETRPKLIWVYSGVALLLLVLVALWLEPWAFTDDSGQVVTPAAQQEMSSPSAKAIPSTGRARDDLEASAGELKVHDLDVAGPNDGEQERRSETATTAIEAESEPTEPETVAPATSTGNVRTERRVQGRSPASALDENAAPKAAPAALPTTPVEAEPLAQVQVQPLAQASEQDRAVEEDADAAQDQLQLVFLEDCWLEVRDATGKTVVADLAKAGQTRTYTGVAPFEVLLGDATAAALILLNEQNVPFAARPGRRVLRMTVGE